MPAYGVVKNLVSRLGSKIGLSNLSLDKDGVCSLVFDEKIVVNMECEDESNRLVFYSSVAKPEEDDSIKLFHGALEKNMQFHEQGELALGFDEQEKALTLMEAISTSELEYPQFEEHLRKFVDAAEVLMDTPPRPSEDGGDTSSERDSSVGTHAPPSSPRSSTFLQV